MNEEKQDLTIEQLEALGILERDCDMVDLMTNSSGLSFAPNGKPQLCDDVCEAVMKNFHQQMYASRFPNVSKA